MTKLCASFFILLTFLLLPFPSKALENIKVGTSTRTMIVYAPNNLGQKRPMIISCHGSSQDASYQQSQAHYSNIADTAKFLVVFPNGISNSWDISGTSDIDFMTAIIDTMVNRYNIDRNRVYLSGFSMGGMFTYWAMGKIADKIAAFAPISGYLLGGSSFTSARPIPILHIHGTGDDVVSFSGVAACLAGWVKRNNCPSTAVVTAPYPASRPSSVCTKSYWGVGDEGSEVVLMELAGKGHWISTDSINGIYTSEEIWKFCKKFSLNLVNPVVKITSPVANQYYTTFDPNGTIGTITLLATASDPDGSVANVTFYDGATLLFSDDKAPYTFDMTNVAAGTHTIKAVVTDNEGKTGQTTLVFNVIATQTSFTVSSNFTAGGLLPAGWKTYDGAESRLAPLSGLSSGCRILQLTGSPRDFDYGMYIRNTTGAKNAGYASYANSGSGAQLILAPGIYEVKYVFANWNNASMTELTCQVESQSTGSVIGSRTTKPVNNIGNATTNSFSGSKNSSLVFTVTESGNYSIKFCTADLAMADAMISNIQLSKVLNDPLASYKSLLNRALGDAKTILKAAADTLYAGTKYTNLNNLFLQYNEWSSTSSTEYESVVQILNASTQDLVAYKQAKDASETQVVVYKDNFNISGGNSIPAGWRTFDSSTQRKGTLTGLGSGSRILQFTGTQRDFDYGFYIRNIAGTANMGFAKFGAVNCDSILTLTPGKYKLNYKVCNWNMSGFGAITGKVANRADSSAIATSTVTPTTNIGNSAANSFTGATPVEINFTISKTGNYALEFYTANSGWGDAIVSNILLSKIVYVGINSTPASESAKVSQIRYYNSSGMELKRPTKGLIFQRTLYDDGTVKVTKSYLR